MINLEDSSKLKDIVSITTITTVENRNIKRKATMKLWITTIIIIPTITIISSSIIKLPQDKITINKELLITTTLTILIRATNKIQTTIIKEKAIKEASMDFIIIRIILRRFMPLVMVVVFSKTFLKEIQLKLLISKVDPLDISTTTMR